MDEPIGALDTNTSQPATPSCSGLGLRRQTVGLRHPRSVEAITLADRIVVMTRRPGRIKLVYDGEAAAAART